jgi:nitrogen-specific signal transduction histidine kinase
VHDDQTPPPVNASRDLEVLQTQLREIAHEINNPLGVIRMTAYFLDKGGVTPEKLSEYAGLINQSLDRIEAGMKRLNELRRSGTAPPGGG